MAVYVTSDAHGHVRALEEAIKQANIQPEDTLYVLGDMVDRGPAPIDVVKLVRSMPNAQVIMGNHERMMIDALVKGNRFDSETWNMNGGWATVKQYDELSHDEQVELLAWMQGLPLYKVIEVNGRQFILVHAGIDSIDIHIYMQQEFGDEKEDGYSTPHIENALLAQGQETLLWIRDGFWDIPTGLINQDGAGPIVICGHTPSVNLGYYVNDQPMNCEGLNPETGHGQIVEVGACKETNYTPDKIDIDCSAASGSEFGSIGVMRLDDFEEWVVPIQPGE